VIALDTNVLVRYLVEDDDAQTARAAALIEGAAAGEDPLFVSQVVLCEVVWVLVSVYDQSRAQVQAVLDGLVRASHLHLEDAERLRRALVAYTGGQGDFADYVIRERARAAGCDHVATFDKKLLREEGFVAP
jgi:predicted nucleic-acid-binding protein